jgi:hypothetical protein
MGSGGALTLWPPSNEAGAYGFQSMRYIQVLKTYFLANIRLNHPCTNVVIDGGTLKREQSD